MTTKTEKKFSVPELVAMSIVRNSRELRADLAVDVRESIEEAIYSELAFLTGTMAKEEAEKVSQILRNALETLQDDRQMELVLKLQEVLRSLN